MKRTKKTAVLVACVVAGALLLIVSMLFHGYFDPGKFEIKQVRSYSSSQVAVLAERTDHQALGGLTYFVLVGNHLLTPSELRHAYHSDATLFSAGSDCIDLRWESQNHLVITCHGSTMNSSLVDVQKQHSGSISISYENIPIRVGQ